MSNYHAFGSEVVDVQVSGRLTIDCRGKHRIDAQVLERGDGTTGPGDRRWRSRNAAYHHA